MHITVDNGWSLLLLGCPLFLPSFSLLFVNYTPSPEICQFYSDRGLTQTCDKSHDYKRIHLGKMCVSQEQYGS